MKTWFWRALTEGQLSVAPNLFNSVTLTKGAKFMMMDISNLYLMTLLKRPEYIRMKITDIPEKIILKYKLRDIVESEGSIYIMAISGMYGLPHAGLLANELLEIGRASCRERV